MKNIRYLFLVVSVVFSLTACHASTQAVNESISQEHGGSGDANSDIDRPAGWSDATHGSGTAPNYETVFPQDKVNRLDIVISEENWSLMLANMTTLIGEFGQGSAKNGRPGPEGQGELPGNAPVGAGQGELTEENPVWVDATVEFDNNTWQYVGVRFKGNSSLRSAWSSGNYKLPFKLDFDQFEDNYPQIDDQRFYGFKQLSLANNFNDDSYLREKVAADIFREFGVPSAHTAFYKIYVDYGAGSIYFGLYTMVEVVEDTVIQQQFSNADGNLYKPDGSGATFAAGSFTEASFDKETHQEGADYSDIQALFTTLHADTRLTQPVTWRTELENVFDVDLFLRWLAVNTVIQNWDTYGTMSHNYFLYTDPESELITWIPWDNNHALSGTGMQSTLSLSLDEVNKDWPLIRFLMDDPVYRMQYENYLGDVIETVFVPEEMAETYAVYHALIADAALAETSEATMLRSEQAFEASVQILIQHVNARSQEVQTYLQN